MLQIDSLLGKVPLKEIPNDKFGLPFPSSINQTWVLRKNRLYAEYLLHESAILITPYSGSEVPRFKTMINMSQSCFSIPERIADELSHKNDRVISFEVYRCFELILSRRFSFQSSQGDSSSVLKFEFFNSNLNALDSFDRILKRYPGRSISAEFYQRLDALLYKAIH